MVATRFPHAFARNRLEQVSRGPSDADHGKKRTRAMGKRACIRKGVQVIDERLREAREGSEMRQRVMEILGEAIREVMPDFRCRGTPEERATKIATALIARAALTTVLVRRLFVELEMVQYSGSHDCEGGVSYSSCRYCSYDGVPAGHAKQCKLGVLLARAREVLP